MTTATLRVEGLCVPRGGRPVLRDVSVEVPPGEVTALLGPNGAGKSTLVLAVGGVVRPTAGTIRLDDQDLTKRRPEQIRHAGVAVVPEGRRLLPDLTVADNLRVATYALDRDHSTVMYAVKMIEVKRAADVEINQIVVTIEERLRDEAM